jgi:hypothetical protein
MTLQADSGAICHGVAIQRQHVSTLQNQTCNAPAYRREF